MTFSEEYWEKIRENIPQGKKRKELAFKLFKNESCYIYNFEWDSSSYVFLDAEICAVCFNQMDNPRLSAYGDLRHSRCDS